MDELGLGTAVVVGFAQSLALMPGVSRSGITITAGRFLGLDRDSAARVSFLLLIPITFGAVLFKGVTDVALGDLPPGWGGPFLVGMLASAGAGLCAIWGLLGYVRRHTYGVFVVYRLVLAALIVLAIASEFSRFHLLDSVLGKEEHDGVPGEISAASGPRSAGARSLVGPAGGGNHRRRRLGRGEDRRAPGAGYRRHAAHRLRARRPGAVRRRPGCGGGPRARARGPPGRAARPRRGRHAGGRADRPAERCGRARRRRRAPRRQGRLEGEQGGRGGGRGGRRPGRRGGRRRAAGRRPRRRAPPSGRSGRGRRGRDRRRRQRRRRGARASRTAMRFPPPRRARSTGAAIPTGSSPPHSSRTPTSG